MIIQAKKKYIDISIYVYIYAVQEQFYFLIFSTCHCSINMYLFQLKERNGKFPVQGTHLSALGMFFWSVNRSVFFLLSFSLLL